jgi:hypothetical protein
LTGGFGERYTDHVGFEILDWFFAAMSFINTYASHLAIPKNLAGDISLLLLFFGLSLAFGFIFGRWKLVNILINIYIVVALLSVLPREFFAFSPYAKAGSFLVLLFVLSMIDSRLFDVHITSAGTDFFWRLFVMSILVTGMLVSVTLAFLPKTLALGYISPIAYGYFASPWALIVWMILPLLSLLFINNRLK